MWTLKVVKGAELADQLVAQVQLPQPLQRFSIGRDPANAWTIADRSLAISARHCEIVASSHGPALHDLSTNGTFVNGALSRLAGEHLLRDGDRFVLGPYEIAVSGPPLPERPARPVRTRVVAAAPARAGLLDTALQRGGDPAAMLAVGGGRERVGLTEILRAAPPSDDTGLVLTRIRVAPPLAVGSAAAPVVPRSRASPPASAPVPPADSLAAALARGLGVPVQALQGRDLLLLVEQLAAAARTARHALQSLPQADDALPPR